MTEVLRLLLIEDSEDDELLLLRALRRANFDPQHQRVQTAPAMQHALEQYNWDIIIADYQLPHFDAPSALHLLQQSGQDIPFIVVSGTIGEQVAVELMRAGASDYVMKGSLERLPEAVRRELREAAIRADRKRAEAALQSLIKGTASFTGVNFFQALVREIARSVSVGYVLVNELVANQLHSIAYWANGTLHEAIVFSIEHTPCEQVLHMGSYSCTHGLQQRFPQASVLPIQACDSYLGVALYDALDRPSGTLSIFDSAPLQSPEHTRDLLRVFAARAAAELERQKAMRALEQINHNLERIVEQRTAELRKTNAQLEATNFDLARATRMKDEFLANMSHELRTPLNSILGLAESLKERIYGELNERQIGAIATIEHSGKHLLNLINDILDLAKIASGKLALHPGRTNLTFLCQNSALFVREQALRKQIQLQIEIPESLRSLEVLVDELRLRQALMNLLANAVKFTPEGGSVRLLVELSSQPDSAPVTTLADWLVFSVVDTGIGISSEYLEHLFQPFVQIDSSLTRQQNGTGLGLALVKQIAELHGGRVGVESQPGVGSCFSIALPGSVLLQSAHLAVAEQSVPDTGVAHASSAAAHEPVILLAEDNELNITMLVAYLQTKGFKLLLANNGLEAVRITEQQRPNLILMDVQMPQMDGLEATRRIRANPALADIPIIALTALAMPGDAERCLQAGATGYLAKPVRLKQLLELIQQHLAH